MTTETKTRARPAAVTLTPSAEQRIADLMANAPEGTIGVKLSTPRRGCSGLAYSVDYVSEEAKFDEKIATPGGTFYIDGASVLYLVGSTMDWVEDDFTAGFTFANPNAKGACGCGENGRRQDRLKAPRRFAVLKIEGASCGGEVSLCELVGVPL